MSGRRRNVYNAQWVADRAMLNSDTGCLEFRHGLNENGYPRFNFNGRHQYIHRMEWARHYGPIPDGMVVCHRCDNPSCVAIGHLFIGTQADNMADCAAKGRTTLGDKNPARMYPERVVRGADHPNSRLSEDSVKSIIKDLSGGAKSRDLAVKFGVSEPCICDIAKGRRWSHIDRPATIESKASKLAEGQVRVIRMLQSVSGITDLDISRAFRIGRRSVNAIRNNETWRHVT